MMNSADERYLESLMLQGSAASPVQAVSTPQPLFRRESALCVHHPSYNRPILTHSAHALYPGPSVGYNRRFRQLQQQVQPQHTTRMPVVIDTIKLEDLVPTRRRRGADG